MTKRRSSRKSGAEARIERLTWFSLVVIFAVLNTIPEGTVPHATTPIAGAVILLGSGLVQYGRRWHVSPLTWIGGTVMLMLGLYNTLIDPDQNFLGLALIVFACVIGFGAITNET